MRLRSCNISIDEKMSDKKQASTTRKRRHVDETIFESWSRTFQYTVRGRHKWTIDDFMRRATSTEVGDSIMSPIFSVEVKENHEILVLYFQLEVFPNGEEGEDNSDYVAVFLTSKRQAELDVKYDFSVLKSDGTVFGRIGNTVKRFSQEQNSWGYGKAFLKAKLFEKQNEMLPNGNLTLVCNLEVFYGNHHISGKKDRADFYIPESQSLLSNLNKIFDGNVELPFSDVVVVCDGKSFRCHKFVLATRSDVFAAMFSQPMKESTDNVVKVVDADPVALENFIRFIYTDSVLNIANFEDACGVLPLADKYNVQKLKASCEKIICDSIDLSNVLQALCVGHLHDASHLQSFALDFVALNLQKLIDTPQWNRVMHRFPGMLTEILKKTYVAIEDAPPLSTQISVKCVTTDIHGVERLEHERMD